MLRLGKFGSLFQGGVWVRVPREESTGCVGEWLDVKHGKLNEYGF